MRNAQAAFALDLLGAVASAWPHTRRHSRAECLFCHRVCLPPHPPHACCLQLRAQPLPTTANCSPQTTGVTNPFFYDHLVTSALPLITTHNAHSFRASCSYHIEEHMLSPWQLGVPLERARYYLLAWRLQGAPVDPPVDSALLAELQPPPMQLLTALPPPTPPNIPLFSYLLPPQTLNPSLFLSPPLVQKFHGQILDVVPGAAVDLTPDHAAAAAVAVQHTRASTFTKACATLLLDVRCCGRGDVALLQIWREIHEGQWIFSCSRCSFSNQNKIPRKNHSSCTSRTLQHSTLSLCFQHRPLSCRRN